MIDVRQTKDFRRWLSKLDSQARARVGRRIRRIQTDGHFGDTKPVGDGVAELRVHFGPGYRVYYIQVDAVVLLTGGDKGSQSRDIAKAKQLAAEWRKD